MNRPPLALMGVLTLVGFLFVVTGSATSAANRAEEPRKRALINQILEQQSGVDDLDKAVAEVRSRVAQAQVDAGRLSQQQLEKNRDLEVLGIDAGTVSLKGPGLQVKLSDAPRQSGSDGVKFDASRIQDSDLQLVVNALFSSGAEAVAVNDNRVVAVTPIRAAGGTIVVNYRPVNSPYRIVAIGADRDRFDGAEIAAHFREWKKKFNLGYEVEDRKNVSVPAYSGAVAIDLAVAQNGPSGSEAVTSTAPSASRRR